MCVVCWCCCLRNNDERKLNVVRLIKPYQFPCNGISDAEVSDTDSNDVDGNDGDESADELVSASESAADQSSAPGG